MQIEDRSPLFRSREREPRSYLALVSEFRESFSDKQAMSGSVAARTRGSSNASVDRSQDNVQSIADTGFTQAQGRQVAVELADAKAKEFHLEEIQHCEAPAGHLRDQEQLEFFLIK